MADHNQLGKKGEDLATDYLVANGYKILDRNWRFGKGEVDIVCIYGNYAVFVEVKTRSTGFFGQPEEAVDKKKRRYLIRAADAYVNQKDLSLEVRYDIISIIFKQNTHTLKHIEDAFYPTL